MKDFAIVKNYGTHVCNNVIDLAPGQCYGRVRNVVYIFTPWTGRTSFYRLDGSATNGTYVRKECEEIIFAHRNEWDHVKAPRMNVEKREIVGSPKRREIPRESLYKSKPRYESLDHEYTSGLNLHGYNGCTKHFDPFKPFEHGQNTAGEEQFMVKKNGLPVHDGKIEVKDKDKKKKSTFHVYRGKNVKRLEGRYGYKGFVITGDVKMVREGTIEY